MIFGASGVDSDTRKKAGLPEVKPIGKPHWHSRCNSGLAPSP
jgi:hypothetical protein